MEIMILSLISGVTLQNYFLTNVSFFMYTFYIFTLYMKMHLHAAEILSCFVKKRIKILKIRNKYIFKWSQKINFNSKRKRYIYIGPN